MSQLAELKTATSLHGVAALLGYSASGLSYILYKMSPASKYTKFSIPKRGGGTRQISAPTEELKLLQRRLADLLQNCAEEIRDANHRNDTIAHGFKRQRSIITNAKAHRNRRYVFNVDLKDFFGHINFGRVRGFFISDNDFKLHEEAATVLAQIACHENALPQGSPCSPVVSNLIGHILDIHLVRLAARNGCSYTRYADDLTFSTNKREFPESIAKRDAANEHRWIVGKQLATLIEKSGFIVNPAKVRMQYRDSRQGVTGLVVNKKVNVRSEYRHNVRAMVHRLFTTGKFTLPQLVTEASGKTSVKRAEAETTQLQGMLGFIDTVDLHNQVLHGHLKSTKQIKRQSSKELMYRRFILFTQLYGASAPVIICEGKTDYVYLLHAIRSLAKELPDLAAIEDKSKIKLKVRLYKYRGGSTSRVLGLLGGASHLGQLMRGYRAESQNFKAPGKQHPVIIVIDNDSAADPLYNTAREITGQKPKRTDEFTHITANMYLVATPLGKGKSESRIEDFFDKKTKDTLIGGKKFDPNSEIDTDSHYGKVVFAYKVVEAQADTIDFKRFMPLLSRITSVIKTHAAKFPTTAKKP